MWQKCLDCINELMDILFANPNIFVGENILEESENLQNVDQVKGCTACCGSSWGAGLSRGPILSVFFLSHCVSVAASSPWWNEWMKNLPK